MPQLPLAAFLELYQTFGDGRLTNVYYRREQLARLRKTLVETRQAVLAAIFQDEPGVTPAEAFVELYMTIAAIKQFHDGLHPSKELATEYSIAHGRDAPDARTGVGVVVIVPQAHSLLYSVVVPLSAAIAAGNCVAVVLENTRLALPPLLQTALKASLDPDIFEIVPFAKVEELSGGDYILVIQTGDLLWRDRPDTLLSWNIDLSIAVVDRTADLEAAAKALVDARMQFGGRSPYAPDVVLVNEFVKTDFLLAAMTHAIRYMTELNGGVAEDTVHGVQPRKGIQTVTSGSGVRVFDVVDRTALASVGKVLEQSLYIHAIRSLDDAIDVANHLSLGSAAAAFAFGDLLTCKYLLQFLPAPVGLANHFPQELLVMQHTFFIFIDRLGPIAPQGNQSADLAVRYSPDMFSVPQPRFVHKTSLSRLVDLLLRRPGPVRSQEQSDLLDCLRLEDRAPVRHIAGYFESAALVGFATVATPVLMGIGYLGFIGIRKALAVAWK